MPARIIIIVFHHMVIEIKRVDGVSFVDFPFHPYDSSHFFQVPGMIGFHTDMWMSLHPLYVVFSSQPATQHVGHLSGIQVRRVGVKAYAVVRNDDFPSMRHAYDVSVPNSPSDSSGRRSLQDLCGNPCHSLYSERSVCCGRRGTHIPPTISTRRTVYSLSGTPQKVCQYPSRHHAYASLSPVRTIVFCPPPCILQPRGRSPHHFEPIPQKENIEDKQRKPLSYHHDSQCRCSLLSAAATATARKASTATA